MAQQIYLDNSSTTKPSPAAISAMMPYLTDKWGIPSAPHQKGQEIIPQITESYKALYAFLGAKEEDELIITSSGAEGVSQVVFGAYRDVTLPTGKNHFITSNIDEAPSLMSINRLEPFGCLSKMALANKEGKVTRERIADMITPRTALISLSWANGLTGVIQPVAEIGDLCRERGIAFHLDATHVLGKIVYELEDVGASFITFNGDQLHAPKGVGALWIKKGVKCSPLIAGGTDQGGFRAGPLNVPGLIALAEVSKEALENRDYICTEISRLRNKLEEGIKTGFPAAIVHFQEQERLPNITAISFPGVANEALLFALNRKGVFAGMGGGNFQQIGLLMLAAGVEESLASSTLSFSLSRYTTEEEIDKAIEIIVDTANKMRKGSKKIVT